MQFWGLGEQELEVKTEKAGESHEVKNEEPAAKKQRKQEMGIKAESVGSKRKKEKVDATTASRKKKREEGEEINCEETAAKRMEVEMNYSTNRNDEELLSAPREVSGTPANVFSYTSEVKAINIL
ncbi:Fc.00g064380.m01.CDS01 [Cosmosporella sp. VM-42]